MKNQQINREQLIKQLKEQENIESLDEDRLKIDADFGLEELWIASAAISGLCLLIFVFGQCGKSPLPTRGVWVSLSFISLFIGLYKATNNFYILDFHQGKILYHQQFFFFKSISVVCRFDELAGFSVSGKQESSKTRKWWESHIVLVTKQGKVIRLSDSKEDGLVQQNEIIRQLADLLHTQAIKGEEWLIVRAKFNKTSGETELHLQEPPFGYHLLKEAGLIIVIIVIFALAALLSYI